MINNKKLLMKKVMVVLSAVMVVACGTRKQPYAKSGLSEFIYKGPLPAGCLQYSSSGTTSFPFDIASNPYLSANPKFLKSFAGQLLNYDQSLTGDVTSGLFSVFESEYEIGLFGLEFNSESSAAAAEELLRRDSPDPDHFRVFRKNKLLIQLWSAEPSDSCFVSLLAAVTGKLNS